MVNSSCSTIILYIIFVGFARIKSKKAGTYMKQKFTITIADTEMNVITEESPEFVDEIVGILDRKIREINTASRRCSKNEAALLCALDYCSDKIKMQKKVRMFDAEMALKNAQINHLTEENEKLRSLLRKNGISTDSK